MNGYQVAVLRSSKRDIDGTCLEDSVVYGVATTEREDVWKMSTEIACVGAQCLWYRIVLNLNY